MGSSLGKVDRLENSGPTVGGGEMNRVLFGIERERVVLGSAISSRTKGPHRFTIGRVNFRLL